MRTHKKVHSLYRIASRESGFQMTVLIWIAIALMIVIFVLSHGQKTWSDLTATRLSVVLWVLLGVFAIAKACG